MYARDVEEYAKPLTFGVSGRLMMNALVMYDRQTDTLWSQILGQGVKGKLSGTTLKPVAATLTTWANWSELNPRTLALDKGSTRLHRSYTSRPFVDPLSGSGAPYGAEGLPRRQLGIGVSVNGEAAYYPFSRLAEQRVVNDHLAGQPLLVVFWPDTATALIFDRQVNDRELTFTATNLDSSQLTLVDAETGTRWSGWTGGAIEGALDGAALQRVPATTVFWFAWKDYYPDTHVYGSR